MSKSVKDVLKEKLEITSPIKEITGHFSIARNDLTLLEGAPEIIGADFLCAFNYLTSLEGCPKEVKGDFYCKYQKSNRKFTIEEIRAVCKVGGIVHV